MSQNVEQGTVYIRQKKKLTTSLRIQDKGWQNTTCKRAVLVQTHCQVGDQEESAGSGHLCSLSTRILPACTHLNCPIE